MLTPRPGRPHRVAVLSSRRAPGLATLLDAREQGARWNLVAFLTSDATNADADRASAAGAPVVVHDIHDFYRVRGARPSDLGPRPEFDRETVTLLKRHTPDLIILCGYLHILTAPMLDAYANRIINVHDSDLSTTDPEGMPRFRGLHATRDAVFAGEQDTRSTVHLVTPEVDVGPPLVRSWRFPVHPLVQAAREWGATDILKAYAYAHREWMMRAAWGALLQRAITLFASGDVRVLSGRAVVAGGLRPLELAAPQGDWRAAQPAAAGD